MSLGIAARLAGVTALIVAVVWYVGGGESNKPVPMATLPPIEPAPMPREVVDPNVRMSQVLIQSEDIRQIGPEWRRGPSTMFDRPSHLTPERIHGGIVE